MRCKRDGPLEAGVRLPGQRDAPCISLSYIIVRREKSRELFAKRRLIQSQRTECLRDSITVLSKDPKEEMLWHHLHGIHANCLTLSHVNGFTSCGCEVFLSTRYGSIHMFVSFSILSMDLLRQTSTLHHCVTGH